jgi:hypothetical protein
MTSRISHTTVDSRDAYAQSVWWGQVLGFSEDPRDPNEPGHEECMLFSPDGRQRVLFIEVPEGKSVKNRIHFDLWPTDRTMNEEVDRLLALGASMVHDLRDHRGPGTGWATLADPEGNEFCVLRSESERPDPYAHLVR